MSDEFTVSKIVEVGSEGGRIEFYNLYLTKTDKEIEEMTADELCRLSDFLASFTKGLRKEVRDGK